MRRILVSDDDADVCDALRFLLKRDGYEIARVESPAAAAAAVRSHDFDAALVDLNYALDTTSGEEGLALIDRLRSIDPMLPLIAMTAWGSVPLAVEAMRRGARDFIEKPWENERLRSIVRTQVELGRALRQERRLKAELAVLRDDQVPPLIGESSSMSRVLSLARTVAASDAAVLIVGENGTGKGLLAKALHAWSSRAGRPLISVNAAGLSESLFEAEIFGHVKGAFTGATSDRIGRFEMAHRGTIFLDEIALVSPSAQAKLLRVVETGEFEPVGASRTKRVDARIVCATNADLEAEIRNGRFRQDLYFRLNTIELALPPLRERREDIPVLAEYFLKAFARKYRKNIIGFSPRAFDLLRAHQWPGNVRECQTKNCQPREDEHTHPSLTRSDLLNVHHVPFLFLHLRSRVRARGTRRRDRQRARETGTVAAPVRAHPGAGVVPRPVAGARGRARRRRDRQRRRSARQPLD